MRKPHLLILEDDTMQQKLYKIICERFGFEYRIFGNCTDALSLLEQDRHGFDVCLMDWSLQDESGLDCIQKIRKLSVQTFRRGLPIVMVTAHAMQGDREICLRAGADDYVAKPFTLESFHSTVMRWVDQSRNSLASQDSAEFYEDRNQESEHQRA
jgi:DNA-binding response OmpR family regulator